jgi:hypothetical protein
VTRTPYLIKVFIAPNPKWRGLFATDLHCPHQEKTLEKGINI